METEHTTSVQPDASEMQTPCQCLRKQVLAILVLLIIVSGTFNIYLWRQAKQRHAELEATRAQIAPLMAEYNQMAPRMDEFINRIREYGRSHPDFGPLMVKYGLMSNTTPVVAAPPAKK